MFYNLFLQETFKELQNAGDTGPQQSFHIFFAIPCDGLQQRSFLVGSHCTVSCSPLSFQFDYVFFEDQGATIR